MSTEYLSTATLCTTNGPPLLLSNSQSALEVPIWDPLLTTRETGVVMKVSVEALKKWRQRRVGPPFIKYPTGAVRYRLSAVHKFINDCTAKR